VTKDMNRKPTLTIIVGVRLIILLAIVLGCLGGGATAEGPENEHPVFRGTVNIVLGNANGIVALTDSNQTMERDGRYAGTQQGQKLFRLDDRTVCTIAGFASTSIPSFPEFIDSSAQILDIYEEKEHEAELRGQTELTFHEKLIGLTFLFRRSLFAIGNLQNATPQEAGKYKFELILAGYDTDGTLKVGKIVLGASTLPNGLFTPIVEQVTERTVGRELIVETAGIGGVAVQNILAYPAQLPEDPEVRRYATALATNGRSLTLPEMEALARSLARHAAAVNHELVPDGSLVGFRGVWPVGGQDQLAVLAAGKIRSVDHPAFLQPIGPTVRSFSIVLGIGLDGRNRPGTVLSVVDPMSRLTDFVVLFFRVAFLNGTVVLDNGYYVGDKFTNCKLTYNGGVAGFENNEVTDCELLLGPFADRRARIVNDLLTKYHWKNIVGK
jgi:hypothetical protein